MSAEASGRGLIERALARPVSDVTRAAWGFTNRTDMITLDNGERVVLQRYRRREDAEYRLRVMRGLRTSAARAGIPLPRVRDFSLDADPAWVVYDVLPGVPVPEAGQAGPGGPRFPQMARIMGELLAAFRRLPAAGLEPGRLWADPGRLAASAAGWARQLSITNAGPCLDAVPSLFAGRPVVLAHGDFAPVNVLTDGEKVTGLLDFEAVRLADPLFDAAWWAWSVSFSSPGVLQQAWPAFLDGAGIDAAEPGLTDRVRALAGATHARATRRRQSHPRHHRHRDGPVARDTRLTSTHPPPTIERPRATGPVPRCLLMRRPRRNHRQLTKNQWRAACRAGERKNLAEKKNIPRPADRGMR